MKGTIKNYNRDKGFGFIAAEGQDVFFPKSSVADGKVQCEAGEQVEFETAPSKVKPGTLVALNVRRPGTAVWGHPSSFLFKWGFIQLDDTVDEAGATRPGALHDLEKIALKEDWAYGAVPGEKTPFPILRNYLINTFHKLYTDGLVKEVSHGAENWAAFNTGLVDDRYEPIYCLFKLNNRPQPRWRFSAFCRANIGRDGKSLVQHFNPLPPAARYFENPQDVVFDPDIPVQPRYDHLVYDSIERDRYPSEFLKQHVPNGIAWTDPNSLGEREKASYLRSFRKGLEGDAQVDRAIRNRIDDAIKLAVKRARWNFKTGIPVYYPRAHGMSLLLPIALVSDDRVDLALVVSRTIAGGYSGETVYKLKWAYEHARLVCRPLSDWLSPETIQVAPTEEAAEEVLGDTSDASIADEELLAEFGDAPAEQKAASPVIAPIALPSIIPEDVPVPKKKKFLGIF